MSGNEKGGEARGALLLAARGGAGSSLRRLLRRHRYGVVGQSPDPEEAFTLHGRLHPDLVIMELDSDESAGLQLMRRMLERRRSTRVLIVSAREDAIAATRALGAGAFGYVTRSSGPPELARAIAMVAAGRRYVSAEIAQTLALRDYAGLPRADLSEREIDILRLLGSGYSLTAIAKALGLTAKTVSNYQTAIKRKLQAVSSFELLRKAAALGLMQLT